MIKKGLNKIKNVYGNEKKPNNEGKEKRSPLIKVTFSFFSKLFRSEISPAGSFSS